MGREVAVDVTGKLGKAAAVCLLGFIGALVPQWLGIGLGKWWPLAGAIAGILIGVSVGLPVITVVRRAVLARFGKVGVTALCFGGIGLLFGLAVSAFALIVLHQITGHSFVAWESCGVALVVLGSTSLLHAKREEFAQAFHSAGNSPERSFGRSSLRISPKVLDTSAIIDGRIADICKTGFLEGTLLVPSFVLSELQRIADSSDALKRNRGRRGLDILNRMQKEGSVAVKIYDRDFEDLSEVDTKIVRLARLIEAKVITNDFNLNKVAELYGVSVLNINELSNAIKPIVLPGEEMVVHLVKDGKEFGQGIAYLEDGTMVVVDGGRQHIGEDLGIFVTSVLQTAAGRMIFGKPKDQARHALAQNQ